MICICKSSIACALVLVPALLIGATAMTTQDADAPEEPMLGMDPAAMMEAMRLAQPGPEHEELAQCAGEWVTEVSIYSPMAPDAPPMTQQSTETSKMVLGGRFLRIESKGDFMGTPFEGITYMGFDRRLEMYTLIGMDTIGTYWVTARGVKEDDGVIRMHGEDDDPTGKQVYTFEYEILGPDEYEHRVIFERHGPAVYEEPFTMVKVRSTRKGE